MKQYFSIDSSIFILFVLVFIIIGSPILLMMLATLTIASLLLKAKLFIKCDNGGNCILLILIIPLAFGTVIFGIFGFGLVLFGFWIYFLVKYLNR